MFNLNYRKCKIGYIALKIDISKAYDRVDLSLLGNILQLHVFSSPKFVDLILNCVSTPSFSILPNGSSYGLFRYL